MIVLSRPCYDEIVRQGYRGNEEEICGLLGGTYGPERTLVKSVHQAENVADVPTVRYTIDPADQLAITEDIEANDDDVVGFYHSHPAGPPHPSETDAERATWPDHSYVIAAFDGYPYVGSWRWRAEEGTFDGERVVLEQSGTRQ